MKAFVTGINGQDGSYLAEFLLEKGYEVHGTVRRSSSINTSKIDHLISEHQGEDLFLYYSDLLDSSSLTNLISKIMPDEVYNLAAQSHVAVSFQNPVFTMQTSTLGPLSILESIRNTNKDIKFYQASSSEMYGGELKESLSEDSKFDPKSPYAASKVFAYDITRIYRDSYNMFATNGVLFNHESPRRGETFVTRKITQGLSRISVGLQNVLYLGNLDAKRDWGHAKDYVEAMWMMLQQDEPDDYVIATGKQHSVREFVEAAAPIFGLNIEWMGSGLDEIGIDKTTKRTIVAVNEKYFRPAEVESLLGDATKAKEKLGWEPKTTFKQLVEDMCIYGQ